MNKIKQFALSGKIGLKAIICLAAGLCLDMLMLMGIMPSFLAESGGLQPLDLQFGFSPDYAVTLFGNLTEAGRRIYLFRFHGVDYLFTIIMGLGFFFLIAWLMKKNALADKKIFVFNLLPLLLIGSDLLENFSIDIPLLLNTAVYPGVIVIILICNILKNIFFMASFLTIVILAFRLIFITIRRKIRQKRTENT